MAWIESHQTLSRHRKTLRAAALLKVDRHKLIGHLHELWWWGLDNADIDGRLDGTSIPEIAEGAGWPSKPSEADRFVCALVTAGFLDEENGTYSLHDWYSYAGKLNTRRVRNAKRMREKRAEEARADQPSDARATHMPDTDATRVGLPYQTEPNQTVPPPSEGGTAAPPAALHVVKPLPAIKLTDADLEEIRAEFRDLWNFDEQLDGCRRHPNFKSSPNQPNYVRTWMKRAQTPPPSRNAPRQNGESAMEGLQRMLNR